MKRKGWTIISGAFASAITVAGTWAASNPQAVADGVASSIQSIGGFASTDYVDGKFLIMAGDLSKQGAQINSLSNMNAQMTVSNVQDRLETAQDRLLSIERDLALNPGIASLQSMQRSAAQKVDELEQQLRSVKCYRSAIIAGQEPPAECRLITD